MLTFILAGLIAFLIILRARKRATGKGLPPRMTRPTDDEWAEQAMMMHYMRKGTNEVTFADLHGPK